MTTNALQQAYASNTETPILAFEFIHSAFTGGVLRYVQSSTDKNLEGVVYTAFSISALLPKNDSDGTQQLTINIDNVSHEVYQQLNAVIVANRSVNEKVRVIMKTFLPSDLSVDQTRIELVCVSASINITSAQITAIYAPLYDSYYPRNRYYTNVYRGLRHV